MHRCNGSRHPGNHFRREGGFAINLAAIHEGDGEARQIGAIREKKPGGPDLRVVFNGSHDPGRRPSSSDVPQGKWIGHCQGRLKRCAPHFERVKYSFLNSLAVRLASQPCDEISREHPARVGIRKNRAWLCEEHRVLVPADFGCQCVPTKLALSASPAVWLIS